MWMCLMCLISLRIQDHPGVGSNKVQDFEHDLEKGIIDGDE